MGISPCLDHGEETAHLQHDVVVLAGWVAVVELRAHAVEEMAARAVANHRIIGGSMTRPSRRIRLAAYSARTLRKEWEKAAKAGSWAAWRHSSRKASG